MREATAPVLEDDRKRMRIIPPEPPADDRAKETLDFLRWNDKCTVLFSSGLANISSPVRC
jgi:hypothetical protein